MQRTTLLYRAALVWLALVLVATLTAHWLPIRDPLAQSLPFHTEKAAQPVIERALSGNESDMIAVRQLPCSIQPDLVDDAGEQENSASGVPGTADWK